MPPSPTEQPVAPTARARWRAVLSTALRILIPLLVIGWLIANLDDEQLRLLANRSKNWGLLAGCWVLVFTAVCMSFARWYLLVRTLGLAFRWQDAFRLGFLGYLFNFVSAGAVGGDLFKAIFIAREHPERRAAAVASVIVDRAIGLYALLVVTSAAVLFLGIGETSADIRFVCRMTIAGAVLGGLAIVIVLLPGFTTSPLWEWASGMRGIGPMVERLGGAIRLYRRQPLTLVVIGIISLGIHTMIAVAVYGIAVSMYEQPPTLTEHLVIVPLSMVAGAIPLTPAGLGAIELAMDVLYRRLPSVPTDVAGVTIALAFRVATILVAAVGIVCYWTMRREIAAVLEHADDQPEQRT